MLVNLTPVWSKGYWIWVTHFKITRNTFFIQQKSIQVFRSSHTRTIMIQVTVGIWNPGATQLVCYSDPFCIWIPYVTLVWKSVSTFFSSCASTSLLKDQKSQSSVSTSTEDAVSTSTSNSIDNVLNVEKTKMSVTAELSQALSTGIDWIIYSHTLKLILYQIYCQRFYHWG